MVNEHLSRWVVQGVANNRKLAVKLRTDGHKVFGPGVADIGLAERTYAIGVAFRNASPSVLHKRHIGRVLRSSCNFSGRRLASSRGRESQPGRCPPIWPGDLRNDGGSVSAVHAARSKAGLDGALRSDNQRYQDRTNQAHLKALRWLEVGSETFHGSGASSCG